ncbi:MAG: phosphopantetheine-binding protein, partial [Candidatus Binatia bacterium]
KATDIKPGIGSPIGVPIPDLELYVLDKNRQLVPIGIPGELYVGGAGVGRAYLNRPELTAERFLANPFSKTGKLYKTGDLVRRLSNGDIEYLGRADDQLKIRGFRIEPGEIETVLLQHPGVREAVVLARQDVERGEFGVQGSKLPEKRLVAYVVARQEEVSTHELRSFVKAKLPGYMVPSAFVSLDKLPLTGNGKIDRAALPVPDQSRPELEEVYIAPRTPVEDIIAGIWAEVLQLGKVGVRDDFFDLGGHSLLATQIVSRMRDAFQVELPVRVLFEKPTIEELALRIEEAVLEEIESRP